MSWVIYGLLSALFASLVAIFGKLGISGIDTTLATTLRSIIMAAFLVVVALATNRLHGLDTITTRTWWYIGAAGIAGALSWLCYFFALKNGPASSVAALDRLSVVFVVILAALFISEKLTLYKLLGSALVVVGAILISL